MRGFVLAKMPDFLMIGAARAGTTAVHSYLRQCPDLFLPRMKEPNFFAFEGERLACAGPGADYINNSVTGLSDYQALFAGAPAGAICGEASPLYLYSDQAAERIRRHVPQARLIVVLRNPVEQAWSHFLYATKQSIETEPDFVRALGLEEARLAAGWQPLFGYSRFPRYADQLARFFERFPREQMLIRLYEDLEQDPDRLMAEMLEFIGVRSGFRPDTGQKLNAGGVPKNRAFQDFLMQPNPVTRAIGLVVPKRLRWAIRDRLAAVNLKPAEGGMPDAARAILSDRLGDQITRLGPMIGRDLSGWLRP